MLICYFWNSVVCCVRWDGACGRQFRRVYCADCADEPSWRCFARSAQRAASSAAVRSITCSTWLLMPKSVRWEPMLTGVSPRDSASNCCCMRSQRFSSGVFMARYSVAATNVSMSLRSACMGDGLASAAA